MNKFEFRRFTPRRKFLSFDTSGAKDDFEKHEPRSRPRMTVRIRFLTAVVAYQRSHSRAEGSQKCTSALCVQLLQWGRRQTGIGPEQLRAAMRLDVAQRLRRDLLPVAGERPRVDAHDALIGGVAGGRAAVLCEPGRTLAEADAAEVADPAHRPLGVQRQRLETHAQRRGAVAREALDLPPIAVLLAAEPAQLHLRLESEHGPVVRARIAKDEDAAHVVEPRDTATEPNDVALGGLERAEEHLDAVGAGLAAGEPRLQGAEVGVDHAVDREADVVLAHVAVVAVEIDRVLGPEGVASPPGVDALQMPVLLQSAVERGGLR